LVCRDSQLSGTLSASFEFAGRLFAPWQRTEERVSIRPDDRMGWLTVSKCHTTTLLPIR